jgi:hypothetical protein
VCGGPEHGAGSYGDLIIWAIGHLLPVKVSGSNPSGPAVGDAFIIRQESVWNSRWRGVSPFSCLSEYYRLILLKNSLTCHMHE